MKIFTVKLGTKNSDSEEKLFIKKKKNTICVNATVSTGR